MLEVIISESAIQDLEEILEFISEDSPLNASNFLSEILLRIYKLRHFKYLGRKVQVLNDDNIRELIFGNYRVIYVIKNTDLVVILAIYNSFRDFNPDIIQ